MLQFLLFSTTIFIAATLHSQNLVSNGNFEDENICTEYIKNCAPEAWIATTLTSNYYFDDAPWAHDGTHFVGLIAGSNKAKGVRSFVCSRLLCSLRKGNRYEVSFYIRSRHDVFDSIGIYFSSTHFLFEQKPLNVTPALLLKDAGAEGYIPGTWKKITMIFTAVGDENFITIGNFKKLETKYQAKSEDGFHYYFFIDQVKLMPVVSTERLCVDADSMKAVIYGENERHTLLEKKKYVYRKAPPIVAKGSGTTVVSVDTLIIPDILFETGSFQLNKNSNALLDSLSLALQKRVIDSIVVEGHTDSVGTLTYNEKLSRNRAEAVVGYITKKSNLDAQLSVSRGLAYLRPVASNKTSAGRQRNRRVEIYVYGRR